MKPLTSVISISRPIVVGTVRRITVFGCRVQGFYRTSLSLSKKPDGLFLSSSSPSSDIRMDCIHPNLVQPMCNLPEGQKELRLFGTRHAMDVT
jgi:hypothetical protein